MGDKLSGRLSRFASDDDFESPFSQPGSSKRSSDLEKLGKREDSEDDYSYKKKKKSSFESLLDQTKELESYAGGDAAIDAFDVFLSEYALDDEDYELRQSLISQGRKYSRETKTSKESSEIAKTFSGNEKLIQDIIDSANADIESISRDINQMRAMRTGRNTKLLSDMCITKKDLYGVLLSAVKESNNMKTKMIELQAKANKEKAAEGAGGDADGLVTRAIGSLIGGGKGNALSIVGGYAGVSGAKGADEDYLDTYDLDDESEEYADQESQVDEAEEGRKYLKYEGMGVQLIATQYQDGSMHVTAEDRDGNIIEDYPLPPNADHQNFAINEKLGTATDDCYRRYVFRKEE